MEKKDFAVDTRYALTVRDPETGRLRPANFYIYRLYAEFMVARMTDRDGSLHKIPYANVVKIVRTTPVPKSQRFAVPAALLDERAWKDRSSLTLYSSSPASGK
ncbi:MAG: hypothetical protein B7Z66_01145 [Chromatiales bacterium 21-64-14]|nr:MAG: hypothetical protein B7Z66_01145 [Chromatiales bacterium 21-64-14]HQU16022.1 hypothetical protein [Gammaproteobacteria bacterium]